ncbi:hypothetical protein JCM10212_000101 [Sporobolomyces blumeae]
MPPSEQAQQALLDFLSAQAEILRHQQFTSSTPSGPTSSSCPEISTAQATRHLDPAHFDGKVVVVTGSASGFGATYAKLVARHGAKVVLSDLDLLAVQTVVDEIKASGGDATGVACNVIDWDAQVRMFRHAIDTYGKIDIVVANAGTASETKDPLLGESVDANGEPKKPSMLTLDVNTTGAIYTVKLGFFHLNQNPSNSGKSIVILGSMASFFGIPGAPLYSASKHAMLGFVRSLYHDAVANGINLNLINPFFCKTGIVTFPALVALAGIPLAEKTDVVNAMVYASSSRRDDKDKGTTGSCFLVDWKGIVEIPYHATGGSLAVPPATTSPASSTDDAKANKLRPVQRVSPVQVKGYYRTFEERAAGAIYAKRAIKDILLAFKSLLFGPPK